MSLDKFDEGSSGYQKLVSSLDDLLHKERLDTAVSLSLRQIEQLR